MSKEIHNPRGFKVKFIESPNKTPRWYRPWLKREIILVHATVSDTLSSPVNWFQNRDSGVSADFVIGKDGTIVRMVPATHISWHAGPCTFRLQTRRDYNYLSYGVELVNRNDGKDPYPDIQLEALAYVCALIQNECPTVRYLRRHADVAVPKGRKSDPAGLPISRIYKVVDAEQPLYHFE